MKIPRIDFRSKATFQSVGSQADLVVGDLEPDYFSKWDRTVYMKNCKATANLSTSLSEIVQGLNGFEIKCV